MLVCALGHDPPVLQLHDVVAAAHGRKPVGDEQDGQVAVKSLNGVHHRLFGGVIKSAGGLVKHQHAGLLVECTGDTDALALTAGETDAAFSHDGVVAGGSSFDEISNLRLTSCLSHEVQVDRLRRDAESDVLG